MYKLFKGTDSEYRLTHYWVERVLGKPSHCENCEVTKAKRFEWANLSGEYLREVSDWARLCVKCHRMIDFGSKDLSYCKNGHEYTPDNTYFTKRGAKQCEVCRQSSRIKYRQRVQA